MLFYIRNRMLEVLTAAYPDEYKKYDKFMLNLSFKEIKTNSKYSFESNEITLNNLSMNPSNIFISSLVSLAEHIDIIQRKETHRDKEYYCVLKKLLITAIERNIVTSDELMKYNDKKILKGIQEYFSNIDNWKIDKSKFQLVYTYIYVYESFMIKNILKSNGYSYDYTQGLWHKRIFADNFDEDERFTEKYKAKAQFVIISDNSFYLRPMYKVQLQTYSKADAPLLRALEYWYDKSRNIWNKLIPARDLEQESENVKEIPKQYFRITENKGK